MGSSVFHVGRVCRYPKPEHGSAGQLLSTVLSIGPENHNLLDLLQDQDL